MPVAPAIHRLGLDADHVLRSDATALRLPRLLWMIVAFGIVYGAVMGTFAGVTGERLLQVAYSALKVPLLLVVAFVLSVPSFYVINTLLGLRDDFAEALRGVVAAQAGLTLILASLAPLTAWWYLCDGDYHTAIMVNVLMFAIASFGAQSILQAHYRRLIARRPAHRWTLVGWLVIYAFVGIQMAWLLRPFIGAPGAAPQFFRDDAIGNAYIELWRIVRIALFG